MERCPICDQLITATNKKEREHVLRKAWLKSLGYLKHEIPAEIFRPDGTLRSVRKPNADSMTVTVGKCCNNGWMRLLDQHVSPNMKNAFKGNLSLHSLDYSSRRQLARWLLKTACVFSLTDTKGDRLFVPDDIRRRAPDPTFLPRGFAAFVAQSPVRDLGIASIQAWMTGSGLRAPREAPRSFKFGVLYDSLLIGCAWTDEVDPYYVTPLGMPQFFTNACSVVALPIKEADPSLTPFRDNPLHRFLLSINLIGD